MITPLTSIEKLYFFDSSLRFPNRIACRLLVEQAIDLEAAQTACYWVGERHPVLGCTIESLKSRLHWIRDANLYHVRGGNQYSSGGPDDRRSSFHWFHVEQLHAPPDEVPDFNKILESVEFYRPCLLIRIWYEREVDVKDGKAASKKGRWVAEIWFSAHHAFCDGAGGIQILNDWIQIYENLVNKKEPTEGLSTLDPQRFYQRNSLGLLRWNFIRNLPFQPIGLFGAAKFVFRRIAVIPAMVANETYSADQESKSVNQAMEADWISSDDLSTVERDARQRNVNLNARFLGDLYKVLHRWRCRRNPAASQKEWLRIILPINVREIGDRRLPAANRSSLIQIDRRPLKEQQVPASFYQSIHREIGIVLKFRLDRTFLIIVRLIGVVPRLLKYVAGNRKPRGLAVFTNLGRPFRRLDRRHDRKEAITFDEASRLVNSDSMLRPIEIDFLAPLRSGTPFNISIVEYQGRLRVTLHYDPHVVSKYEARQILHDYLRSIRRTIPS